MTTVPKLIALSIPPAFEIVTQSRHHLILRTARQMSIAERGHLLLELEKRLRRESDPDIEVFLETKNDVNSLRRLRGVKI